MSVIDYNSLSSARHSMLEKWAKKIAAFEKDFSNDAGLSVAEVQALLRTKIDECHSKSRGGARSGAGRKAFDWTTLTASSDPVIHFAGHTLFSLGLRVEIGMAVSPAFTGPLRLQATARRRVYYELAKQNAQEGGFPTYEAFQHALRKPSKSATSQDSNRRIARRIERQTASVCGARINCDPD